MSVVFTIPGDKTKYKYPTTAQDVTFGEFIGHLDLYDKRAPQIVKDIDAAIDAQDKEKVQELSSKITQTMLSKQIFPYYCAVVSHFTNVSIPILDGRQGLGMNVKQLEAMYEVIIGALAPPPVSSYVYQKAFEWNGKKWEIPDRLMENASVIEFAESAQYQAAMADIKGGNMRSLIDVCAVLLRQPGEKYNENVYKRNRKLFNDLPLSLVWRTAFFLMSRSAKLGRDFQIYTASRNLARLRLASKTLQKRTVGI